MFSYIYQLNSKGIQEDFRRLVEALEANNCLREFHLKNTIYSISIIIEHLCRNETLIEVTMESWNGEYEGELQLCFFHSIIYIPSFRAENHAEEASPPQQNVFPPGLSPSSTVLHTKLVNLTACTVSLMPLVYSTKLYGTP